MLATLAIVVWHFYQVFFDPDIYPMNWTWWDGKMSFEHYREEHALDTDTLLQAAQADQAAESRESPVQENPDSSPLSTKEAEEEVTAPNK